MANSNLRIVSGPVDYVTNKDTRHNAWDLTTSVLKICGGQKLAAVTGIIADTNYAGYALGGAGKLYHEACQIVTDSKKRAQHFFNCTVMTGNVVSDTSDTWNLLTVCKVVKAWTPLAIAGSALGIYSKSIEIVQILATKVSSTGTVVSATHRLAKLAFKVSILAIKCMSIATTVFAVAIGSNYFLAVGTCISVADLIAIRIENVFASKGKA